MSLCPNKNTVAWEQLMIAVKGNEVDATEAWETNNNIIPEGETLEGVRKYFSVARQLRKMSDNQLVEYLKTKTPEFDYWNGRLMLQKHHEIAARNLIADVNKRTKVDRIEIKESKNFRKGGGKSYYAKIGNRSVFKQIDYTLKPVETLLSDKAIQVFDKAEKAGWTLEKTLAEIGGFGNRTGYKELFDPKELNKKVTKEDRERLATEIGANYSYAIEVNTAKETRDGMISNHFESTDGYYTYDPQQNVYKVFRTDGTSEIISKEAYYDAAKNSSYYSNLTVPGGTAYTENEIATPDITPNIKGHAQFSTDNGIGWFRSDEQAVGGKVVKSSGWETVAGGIQSRTEGGIPTKTRRILEVQSDLFQKGRDKSDLIAQENKKSTKWVYYTDEPLLAQEVGKFQGELRNEIRFNTPEEAQSYVKQKQIEDAPKLFPKQNQFLQLLNKDNNWVTFFTKSIIQDSAKKGYEKVLFPKGDTAAKIEGHQTLEEFKKQKEARIKELEDKINNSKEIDVIKEREREELNRENSPIRYDEIETQEEFDRLFPPITDELLINNVKNRNERTKQEIKTLKQELTDVESGQTQLSSIAKFYEETVTNILNKQGYNPKEITDEYGNKWNEVILTSKMKENIFLQNRGQEESSLPPDPKIEARVKEIMADLGIKLEAYDEYAEWYEDTYGKPLHAVGVADMLKGVISVDATRADKFTSLEELSHFILFALKDNKNVIEALSLVESTEEWKNFSEAYIEEYEGDMEMVRLEILGKILKKQLGNEILEERPIWKQRLDRIWKAFLKFFNLNNRAKEARIKESLDKIVADVLSGNTAEIRDNIAKGGAGVFQQIDPKNFENSKILDKHKKHLHDTLSIIKQKIKMAEADGLENFTEKEKVLFEKLHASYSKGKITTGLIDFIEVAETEANGIVKRLPKLEKIYEESLSANDINKFGSLLRDMSGYISSYSEIVNSILADTKRERQKQLSEDDKVPYNELIDALQNISSGIITMQDTYKEYSKKILVERFKPLLARRFSTEAELNAAMEELLSLTEKTSKDISWFRKMFDSSAESGDPIIMMMDKLLKVALENSNLETEEILRDLIDLEENLRKEGLTNDIVVEKDANGIPTGNFISAINEAAFEKDLFQFFTDLRTEFSLTQDPEIDNINLRITNLQKWHDDIESGSKKPFLAADSETQVTNSSEYFGEHLKKKDKNASKEKSLEYLSNQIKYLQKEGVNAYTKAEAHYSRMQDRALWNIQQQHSYDTKIAKWMSSHMEMNPQWENLLKRKTESVYNKIFLFDKDIQFVNSFREKHGEFWLKELEKVNKELYNKAVEAETIIGNYRSERLVENNGKTSFRKNFAKPKVSLYGNSEYQKIMSNPAAKAYYEGVMAIRKKLTAHMGESYADSILLPQIRKDNIERLKTDPLATIAQSAKDAVMRRKGDTDYGLLDESGRPIDKVPLMFFNKLENSEEISTDVTASMIMFAEMANNHRHINNLIDIAEIGRDVMRERVVVKSNVNIREFQIEQRETEGGNAFERYEAMLKMNFYGQMKKDEGDFFGTGLDKGRVADAINRYTSLNSLALNVYAGFSNIILGNILIRTEAFANEFVDNKDVLYADKKYWGDIHGLLADVGKTKSNNKLRLFMEKVDALQDFENRVRDVNTARSRWGRMFNMSSFFFINHMGEHQMQGRMAIALAHRQKLLNAKGEEIPMYEAFEVVNGRLNIIAGTKNLDGSEFTNTDISHFNIRMKAINQRLHGIYNNTDKAAIQQYALGRMITLFRKWMKPAFNRRFDTKYYNYSLEGEMEGSYMTVFNFFNNLKKEVQEGKILFATAKENFDKLSPMEKANMRRAIIEVATLLGAVFAAAALNMLAEGLDDDDEASKWAVNMTAYQANRLVTEIGVFFPLTLPSEVQKVLKSPMASVNTLDQLLSLGKTVDPVAFFTENDDLFTKYKSGRNKGDRKIGVWAKKTIPFVDTVEDWWYPEDRLKYFIQ